MIRVPNPEAGLSCATSVRCWVPSMYSHLPSTDGSGAAFPLRTSDVVIGASDGLSLGSHQLLNAVERTMLHPENMPEAILEAQRGSWDDVTLVCAVI